MNKPLEINGLEGLAPERLADPYPYIEDNRARCPVAHQSPMDAYISYDYADVKQVLADRSGSRDPRRADDGTLAQLAGVAVQGLDANMLFLDPPDHTRLRGLVMRAFTAKAVGSMAGPIRRRARALLADVAGASQFDLVEAFAAPLPTMVIAEMLGVDPADHLRFKTWSDAAVRLLDLSASEEEKEAGNRARAEFGDYLEQQIRLRREHPRGDLMGELVKAADGEDRLSDREIVTTCRLLLSAGNITTTHLIGNAVHALLSHPAERDKLLADPSLVDATIEEVLRFDPPVQFTTRIATGPTEVAGCPVPEGQTIVTSLAGANRDPAEHPRPSEFDISRADPHHLSFGGGLHYCLGAHLARLEGRIAIAELFEHFPALRLADDAAPVRATQIGFRGFSAMIVCP